MYIGLSYFSVSLYSLNLSICISSCLSYSTLTLFFVDFSNKSSSQKKIPKKFCNVCFSSNMSAYKSNLYIDPAINQIGPSTHVRDLCVSMSSNCTFDFHISNLYKRCSNVAGWILRTITIRDT